MHEIMNTIMLDSDSPIMNKKINAEDGVVNISNHADYYMFSCSKALSSSDNAIQNARLSLSLLSSTALDAIATNSGEKSELIQLWVENSIIRVQSIYDRLLILVNHIFDLGLANESMSHNTMVCNEHVRRYGIAVILKKINKKCNDYRLVRNTVIHHDRYTEEALDNVTLFLRTNHLTVQNGGKPFIDEYILDRMVQAYLDTKKEELTAYVDLIEKEINILYSALIPIYQSKKIQFSNIS